MRNSFARLAKRDTARPSLRERAASLKASAARLMGSKSAEASADQGRRMIGGDAEPSLGAPECRHASQVVWLRGTSRDEDLF